MSAVTNVSLNVAVAEGTTGDLYAGSIPHAVSLALQWLSGTTDNKADTVYSDTRSAAASADNLDLRGSLAGVFGTVSFAETKLIYIKNKATTSGYTLTVGAGTNGAFAGLFADLTDKIVIQPGGAFLWIAPLDGNNLATTAGTADILKIDPGSNTVSYDIVIIGASA